MSYWDYRILAEVVGDSTEYFVTEVYYNDDGKPAVWTDRESADVLRGFDDVEDLNSAIRKIQDALQEPVLRVFGNELIEQ